MLKRGKLSLIKNKDLFIMTYPYGNEEKSRPHIVKSVNPDTKYVVKVQSWKPMYRSKKGLKHIRKDQCQKPYPFKTSSCIDVSKLFYMENVVVSHSQIKKNLRNYKIINDILDNMSDYKEIKLDKNTILKNNDSILCGSTKKNHYFNN